MQRNNVKIANGVTEMFANIKPGQQEQSFIFFSRRLDRCHWYLPLISANKMPV